MKPSHTNTVERFEVLGDCWMPLPVTIKYLGISRNTLERRNKRGRLLPHYVDPATGKRYWRKRRLDAEMEHGNDSLILQGNSRHAGTNAIKFGRKK